MGVQVHPWPDLQHRRPGEMTLPSCPTFSLWGKGWCCLSPVPSYCHRSRAEVCGVGRLSESQPSVGMTAPALRAAAKQRWGQGKRSWVGQSQSLFQCQTHNFPFVWNTLMHRKFTPPLPDHVEVIADPILPHPWVCYSYKWEYSPPWWQYTFRKLIRIYYCHPTQLWLNALRMFLFYSRRMYVVQSHAFHLHVTWI